MIPTCKAALPRLWNPLPPHPRTTRVPSAGAWFREPMTEDLRGLASTFEKHCQTAWKKAPSQLLDAVQGARPR